ncbi:MAG: serine/threonine-protein kinase [Pseudanabaenaceae cyanobacterium SKYGB_i_bin29]|nr:serine/threonine protein kinase [Pseudanabaenaceae cyanobacterium SKYG29]MDW8421957.1 serine/threonine-protein kinase [Pseudanabaenaceae cyanobacterium SKYGB_i_bin29]
MQSAIQLGHTLKDRYLVKRVLGQGGMGRTYLAEDLERFRELCVIKEFIPHPSSEEATAKARELFRREASLLYQINHPQVPQFRANFEIDGRLFLVQDYVEGKTYRALLRERLQIGKTFHEVEVIDVVCQVLEILAYLHDRQIIHRDISPDNLMLRTADHKTVLIDFGVGKEMATHIHDIWGATIAGKPGYASPEQLRTGQVFPSSDIYALAVTALVLLTGRDPQELFDEVNLVWRWQDYVSLSPHFAQVLERMLRHRPADRYADAREALLYLRQSQVQVPTMAVGRAPATTDLPDRTMVITAPPMGKPTRPQLTQRGGGTNWLVGIFAVFLAGIGSWVVFSFLNSNNKPPNPTAEPPPPLVPAKPTSILKDLKFGDPLNWSDPNKATASDRINPGEKIIYRLTAKKDQTMTASLTGANLQMTLLYEDQKPIDERSSNLTLGYWQGKLPASGAYFVEITLLDNSSPQEFRLEVTLVNPEPPPPERVSPPTPAPPQETETPPPAPPPPEIVTKTIEFPAGTYGTSVAESIQPNQVFKYQLRLGAEQKVTVAHEGEISVEVFDPNGVLLVDDRDGNPKSFQTASEGVYQILVTGTSKPTDFHLYIDAF